MQEKVTRSESQEVYSISVIKKPTILKVVVVDEQEYITNHGYNIFHMGYATIATCRRFKD